MNKLIYQPLLSAFFLVLSFSYANQLQACPLTHKQAEIEIAGNKLLVDLARSNTERRCGLSLRDKIPADYGMLFIFPKARRLQFWMRNTYVPLSIAFISEQKKVLNIADMEPNQTRTRYFSKGPAIYALEVPKGWFEQNNVKAGDTLTFRSN